MPKASNTGVRWGIAATMMLGVVLGPLALAGPAAAQPPPTPAPNPLESLLPNLLAPLAPLLNPSQKPTAPASGSPAQAKPNVGGAGTTQGPPPIPAQVQVQCGPLPRPLAFARTAPRTPQPRLDA